MSAWRMGSLFSGYEGLGMAVQALLAGRLDLLYGDGAEIRAQLDQTLAWVCEHEPATEKNPRPRQAAARLLAHHHPNVPNLGDVTAVDWSAVERPDVLTGGFPCQDVSSAGRRAGMAPGTRSGLWAHMARAVHVLRPRLVVIENVRGLLSASAACDVEPCPFCLGDGPERPLRALGAVLGDLAVLGYDARWGVVHASDAGAPHERARVFVYAAPAGTDPACIGRHERRAGTDGHAGRAVATAGGWPAADSDRAGRGSWSGLRGSTGPAARGDRAPDAPDPHGVGPLRSGAARGRWSGSPDDGGGAIDWGEFGPAVRRWELMLGRPAGLPVEPGARGGSRLAAPFVEWMQGLPAGHVTDVPGLSRNDHLHLLGNGVCPQQAALAGRLLLDGWAQLLTDNTQRRAS